MADFIGNINPFRYRGYYYDSETTLYYLQSRYYDAEIGRFVNGDEVIFCTIPSATLGHNMYSYCINNPCNLDDMTGHIAIIESLAIIAFAELCTMLMLIVTWMCNSEFVQSWIAFCQSASNELSCLGKIIVDGGTVAWGWTKKKVSFATKEIKRYIIIVRADEKVRRKVSNNKHTYYEANYSSGIVSVGKGITQARAIIRLNSGKNVFTMYGYNARKICALAGSAEPMWHPKEYNVPNYYDHYHVSKHINSAHCWYLI